MYNILEARIQYNEGKLERVTVLVEISQGDIRAITSSAGYKPGYDFLNPLEPVNDALLQRVAGYGMQVSDGRAIFPAWPGKK